MISIGHRTGLFDLLSGRAPSTSAEIAGAAGLDERYVREWLGAMVCGKIIDHDGARHTYRLPSAHAALLTRAAGADNLALYTQYLAIAAGVEEEIVACFRHGGGVPAARYRRLEALQAETSALRMGARLVDAILPLAPDAVERLRAGGRALDAGCGCGSAVLLMAREFPRSQFVGRDASATAIEAARAEAAARGLANARFEIADVAAAPDADRFDLVTAFDVVHDLARPAEALRALCAALAAGGTFLCVDIAAASNLADNVDHPLGPYLYTASTLHCMAVSLAEGGAGLGTAWGEELAQRMLRDAGFTDVAARHLDGDPLHVVYTAHRPA
jgi:2-polyprenyl-3-methyl-5-hydroxy-6-metoxy-1,4-benzoquinol methylase